MDFQKLDESVRALRKSSIRVERRTYCLIGLTAVLAIITSLDLLGVNR